YQFGARGDMPPVKMHWYDGGMRPPRPDELEDGQQFGTNGTLFVGDKGKMLGYTVIPESRRREFGKPPKLLERSPGPARRGRTFGQCRSACRYEDEAHPHQAALGQREVRVHQHGRSEQVSPSRLSRRLELVIDY
ncbi:MAG: hypothetical protein ACYTDV_06580, partial [Planctomycetota bacterium]